MKTNTTPHLRMRDLQPLGVQDIKDQAKRLRNHLKGSVDLKHTQSLEMAAKMQGFESWGQAKAHLEALASKGRASAPLRLSRRRLAGASGALGHDLLNCGHSALVMRDDTDADLFAYILEWAQGEIWHKPGCLYVRRPDLPEDTPCAHQQDRLVSDLAKRMGKSVPKGGEFSYDAVLDGFSKAGEPHVVHGGPFVLSLPWIPGEKRLRQALKVMSYRNIYVMLRIRHWEVDRAAKREIEEALNECDLWVLAPETTLPGIADCHGGKLRNDDDELMAFDASEVRRLFSSPDYKGDLDEVSVPDEEHEIRVALRMIHLMA